MPDETADVNLKNEMKMKKESDTFIEKLVQDWSTLEVSYRFLFILYIGLALGLSCFHLYTAYFGLFEAWAQRAVHLDLVLLIVFFTPRKIEKDGQTKYFLKITDVILGVAALAAGLFMYFDYMNIIFERVGDPNQIDQITCWTLIVLIF